MPRRLLETLYKVRSNFTASVDKGTPRVATPRLNVEVSDRKALRLIGFVVSDNGCFITRFSLIFGRLQSAYKFILS